MIRVKNWVFRRLDREVSELYEACKRQQTAAAVPEGTTAHATLGLRIAWFDLKLTTARTLLGEWYWPATVQCENPWQVEVSRSMMMGWQVLFCIEMFRKPSFWAKLKAKGVENGRN